MLFLFSAKTSGDTAKWQLRATIDLAAHLGEWQLNQDKVAPAREGISLHPKPLARWAGDDAIVNTRMQNCDTIKTKMCCCCFLLQCWFWSLNIFFHKRLLTYWSESKYTAMYIGYRYINYAVKHVLLWENDFFSSVFLLYCYPNEKWHAFFHVSVLTWVDDFHHRVIEWFHCLQDKRAKCVGKT